MVISDLIELLTKAREEHGDVPVYVREEPLASIVDILPRSGYYDELVSSSRDLMKGNYLIIEHEHLENDDEG
jgi:hypothetical protein